MVQQARRTPRAPGGFCHGGRWCRLLRPSLSLAAPTMARRRQRLRNPGRHVPSRKWVRQRRMLARPQPLDRPARRARSSTGSILKHFKIRLAARAPCAAAAERRPAAGDWTPNAMLDEAFVRYVAALRADAVARMGRRRPASWRPAANRRAEILAHAAAAPSLAAMSVEAWPSCTPPMPSCAGRSQRARDGRSGAVRSDCFGSICSGCAMLPGDRPLCAGQHRRAAALDVSTTGGSSTG